MNLFHSMTLLAAGGLQCRMVHWCVGKALKKVRKESLMA